MFKIGVCIYSKVAVTGAGEDTCRRAHFLKSDLFLRLGCNQCTEGRSLPREVRH